MKKTIMIVVIIALIIGLTFSFIKIKTNSEQEVNNSVTNPNNAKFEINDMVGSSGEEVTINIKLLEDCKFVAGNFELLYDNEKMEYIRHEEGKIIASGAMSIINNDKENSKILIAYVGNPQSETCLVEKGDLINITFKLKGTIDNEDIVPEFKATTLKDKEGNDVKCIVNQETITIKD